MYESAGRYFQIWTLLNNIILNWVDVIQENVMPWHSFQTTPLPTCMAKSSVGFDNSVQERIVDYKNTQF